MPMPRCHFMRCSFQYSNHFISCPGCHEELHLHLFELPHAEDELPRHDLVAESLAGLGDPEGDLHPAGLHHIQEIDKDALGGFGPR